jgi:tetratricopeptide (TPR) repeat protein
MMSRTVGSTAENRRIDSWKEIAAFFGRDERTVKRWEKERGLPVHRLPGERGGVFAWSHELTTWLNSAADNGKVDHQPLPPVPPEPHPLDPPATVAAAVAAVPTPPPLRRSWIWASVAILAVVAAALLYDFRFLRRPFHGSSVIGVARPAAAHHTPDPVAREFYLRGRYYWSRRTEGSLRQAIDAFTQAVVHDSEYAQAYAGLAECYDIMPEFSSMPASEAFPRAIAAAQKAVALDDSLSEAHRALGFGLFYWEWKVPAALGEFQRAIELDPRDEEAHHWYATSLLTLGRYPEAMVEIDKALIRFWAGDRAAAVAKLREIEQSEPDFFSAPRYLAGIAFAEKDYRTYIDQSKRLAAISRDDQLLTLVKAAQRGLSAGGEHGMLEAMRAVQQQVFDSGQSSGFDLARTCALLGRKQEAVTYLKAAIANHDYMVLSLSTDHTFDALNGDPAFADLLRQITARIYRA